MELAIVLPVMLLILSGIVDFGLALQQQILLTEAVREGARVGALNGTPAQMQSQVATVVGTGMTLNYTITTPCTSVAGADSTIIARSAYVPITPIVAFMQYFSGPAFSITITAKGVMSCLG